MGRVIYTKLTPTIYEKVESNVGGNARGALELVKKYGNGRKLETFLTETNVKYTWDPYERRHQNAVGSVFHALGRQGDGPRRRERREFVVAKRVRLTARWSTAITPRARPTRFTNGGQSI